MDLIWVVLVGVVIVVGLALALMYLASRRKDMDGPLLDNVDTGLTGGRGCCRSTVQCQRGAGEDVPVTNNQGVFSFCVVNDDKFTKYYFEPKDERVFTTPVWYVIDKSKFKLKRLNELDMLRYVNQHMSPAPCPKVYDESGDVEFDESIFNAIRSHVWYEPGKIQLKKLVMERVKGVTFQQYLVDRGLELNEDRRQIVKNCVPKGVMVMLYRKWWELALRFIDYDIVPDDCDNMANVMVVEGAGNTADGDVKLVALDCSFWLIVVDRPTHVLNEDLLYYYFWGVYRRHRRKSLDIIIALKMHDDWKDILRESLEGLVPESTYRRLLDDYFSKSHEDVRLKQQVLMQLCDENSMRSVGSYELFDLYVSDEAGYNRMVTEASGVMKDIPVDLPNTFDVKELHKAWDVVYGSGLSEAGRAWVFLHAKQYAGNLPDRLLGNVRYLIEGLEMTNEPLTLYPIGKSKCMYVRKCGDGVDVGKSAITTTRYLPLVKANEGCTVRSTWLGDTEVDAKYFYDGFFPVDVEARDTTYVVLEP